MELESKVILDFAGATTLANQMKLTAGYTGQVRTNLAQAGITTQQIIRGLQQARMPNLTGHNQTGGSQASGASRAGGNLALAGTAAAGSAFFYRAAGLANPMAMQRFHDAVDDATAVIGHRMIPALNQMTSIVRGLGNWLANHPTTTTAIGYGGAGLAAAASLAGIYGIGKMTVNAARGAARDIGGMLGYGGAAADVAAGGSAAVSSDRASKAAAELNAVRQEEQLASRLKQLRGLEATGTLGSAAQAAQVEKELTALREARTTQTAATGAAGAGAAGGLGGLATRFGGFALPAASVYAAYQVYTGGATGEEFGFNSDALGKKTGSSMRMAYRVGLARTRANLGFSAPGSVLQKEDVDNLHQSLKENRITREQFESYTKGYTPDATSFNAAARPAEYQDILGSVMKMRQNILSGAGLSPEEQTAENTRIAAEELKKMTGGGSTSSTAGNAGGRINLWGQEFGPAPSDRSTGADR